MKPQAQTAIPALDERGAAAIEGILVFGLVAGLFVACLLLVQWGTGLQSAQMGARLLAYDAGDAGLARLGRASSQPVQQFSDERWDTLVGGVAANWLGGMFALPNALVSGSVTGTARGRAPAEGTLFEYGTKTLGFRARGWAAQSDPWGISESLCRLTFLRVAYHVGLTRCSPAGLDSTCARPIPAGNAVLETLYGRVGR